MTFDELLFQYPDEIWMEPENKDAYCAVCIHGTPCREAITVDVTDILTEAGLSLPDHEDACLQWLHGNEESSLKSSITDLAERFKHFLETNP